MGTQKGREVITMNDEGPLRGRPWSSRPAQPVRRKAGCKDVGLVFETVSDGAGGQWVTVEWGRDGVGRPLRRQHRPEALEWLT